MISVSGLRKSYGDLVVLDGVDLEIPEGSIFALLGSNGAGKSTIVHILSTLIGADAGELRVAGHDVAREPDAVRGEQRGQDPHRGGLARPVRAEQGEHRARRDLEVDSVQHHRVAERLSQPGGRQRGRCRVLRTEVHGAMLQP